MDERSDKYFKGLSENFNVEYYDDDHAMTAPATLARRWHFIAGLAAI